MKPPTPHTPGAVFPDPEDNATQAAVEQARSIIRQLTALVDDPDLDPIERWKAIEQTARRLSIVAGQLNRVARGYRQLVVLRGRYEKARRR